MTIAFLMWYAARVKKNPQLSPTYALDLEKRKEQPEGLGELHGMTARHKRVLWIFAGSLAIMVAGVVHFARIPEGARVTEAAVLVPLIARPAGLQVLLKRTAWSLNPIPSTS